MKDFGMVLHQYSLLSVGHFRKEAVQPHPHTTQLVRTDFIQE